MKALKMCLNWKIIAGLAVVGASLFVFAPGVAAAALPLLILAICPLSMIFMMGAMNMNRGADPSPSAGRVSQGRSGDLAQLKMQQQDLADKIAALEADAAFETSNQGEAATYA